MNKRPAPGKEISRAPAKRLSQKVLRQPDKDIAVRGGRGMRSSNSSSTRKTSVPQKHLNSCKSQEGSDSSLDSVDFSRLTQEMKGKVLDSMKTFKEASAELCSASSQFTEEFKRFHHDFVFMKKEIQNVLDESDRSQFELSKLKSRQTESPFRNLNISTKNSPGNVSDVFKDDPQERILSLRRELEDLRGDLSKNEEEVKINQSQNEELRAAVFKMQDTFEDQSDNEENTKIASCRSCVMI
jgi:regulator of replication initiation timing